MNKLLSRYFQENFFIIPIRKNDKRPLYKKWNKYPLSYMEARGMINAGFNIAVVAKDLWILDYDRREPIKGNPLYPLYNTCIQFTPRGYHVFYRAENEEIIEKILHKVSGYKSYETFMRPDTIRHGDMYCLIAPSKIDGKSYWWLDDMKGEILTL